MMTKIRSAKGKIIDFAQLQAKHPTAVALGNASMNARGDIVTKGGQIVKRREQVAQEYHKKNPNAVKQASLRNITPDVFDAPTPAEAIAKLKEEKAKAKEIKETETKRKIVDSDD